MPSRSILRLCAGPGTRPRRAHTMRRSRAQVFTWRLGDRTRLLLRPTRCGSTARPWTGRCWHRLEDSERQAVLAAIARRRRFDSGRSASSARATRPTACTSSRPVGWPCACRRATVTAAMLNLLGPGRLLRRALPARRLATCALGDHRGPRGSPHPERCLPRTFRDPPRAQHRAPDQLLLTAAGPPRRGAVRTRWSRRCTTASTVASTVGCTDLVDLYADGRERARRGPADPGAARRAGRRHPAERQPGAATSRGPVHRRAGSRQDQGHRPFGPGPQGPVTPLAPLRRVGR